jgi:hypothetical protein
MVRTPNPSPRGCSLLPAGWACRDLSIGFVGPSGLCLVWGTGDVDGRGWSFTRIIYWLVIQLGPIKLASNQTRIISIGSGGFEVD